MSSQKREISKFRQFGIYFIIICCGYALDLVCYVLLVELDANLYAAYVGSFVFGTTCNVVLLRRYFEKPRHSFIKDLLLTLSSNGSLLLLMLGLYFVMMNLFGIPHLLAKILSNGVSFILNYGTRRLYF